MSYHSVRFWQYLPGLSGRSHRLRARPARGPLQVHKLPTLLTDQLSIRGLWNALRFCHLLEWVTELRKSGLLLLLIYCKVLFPKIQMNSQMKVACRARGERRGPELPPTRHRLVFTKAEAHQAFCLKSF